MTRAIRFVCLLGLLGAGSSWAAENIGTVVITRGKVGRKVGETTRGVKVGDAIQEGDFLITGSDGSLKVLMTDKTELVLGPGTTVRAERGTANGSLGSVSVLKGQFRAKVQKSMTSTDEKSQRLRLMVRTKSATMGVRGTDFSVIYNSENQVTSLVTYEGGVAMAKTDPEQAPKSIDAANAILQGDRAVVVTEGNFSSASAASEHATIPTKISPAQFEALKAADPAAPGPAAPPPIAPEKSGSILPPGVDPKAFVGGGTALASAVEKVVGAEDFKNAIKDRAPSDAFGAGSPPPPEGFYDKDTGKMAPPAGGFVDLKTGIYVPPPPGSTFDPNTGVYVPPPSLGGFDPKSGAYVPPPAFVLDPVKGFVPAKDAPPGTQLPPPPPVFGAPGAPPMAGMPGFPGGPMGPNGPLPPPPPPGLLPPPFPDGGDPFCPNCGPPPPPPGGGATTNLNIHVIVN